MVSQQLVNDLDMVVRSADAPSLFCAGNNFDAITGRSRVFGGGEFPTYDRRNNVEQVVFNTFDLGSNFTIEVNGTILVGDALNVWTPSGVARQDFALFVENVIGF